MNLKKIKVYNNLYFGDSFTYSFPVRKGETTMSNSNLRLVPAEADCGCSLRRYCDRHVREIADEPCACTQRFDGFEVVDSGCASCDARAQLAGDDDDLPF
jgi:hypothetical protein